MADWLIAFGKGLTAFGNSLMAIGCLGLIILIAVSSICSAF